MGRTVIGDSSLKLHGERFTDGRHVRSAVGHVIVDRLELLAGDGQSRAEDDRSRAAARVASLGIRRILKVDGKGLVGLLRRR